MENYGIKKTKGKLFKIFKNASEANPTLGDSTKKDL